MFAANIFYIGAPLEEILRYPPISWWISMAMILLFMANERVRCLEAVFEPLLKACSSRVSSPGARRMLDCRPIDCTDAALVFCVRRGTNASRSLMTLRWLR